MKLSISEAARRAGVQRQTLYRNIKEGALSKVNGEDGKPAIELSELARLYPQAVTDNAVTTDSAPDNSGQVENHPDFRLLQLELDHARQRLADMERRAETAEADKAMITRLLTDQREKEASVEERIKGLIATQKALIAKQDKEIAEKAAQIEDMKKANRKLQRAAQPFWKKLF